MKPEALPPNPRGSRAGWLGEVARLVSMFTTDGLMRSTAWTTACEYASRREVSGAAMEH
jgi:hypothetical protein